MTSISLKAKLGPSSLLKNQKRCWVMESGKAPVRAMGVRGKEAKQQVLKLPPTVVAADTLNASVQSSATCFWLSFIRGTQRAAFILWDECPCFSLTYRKTCSCSKHPVMSYWLKT